MQERFPKERELYTQMSKCSYKNANSVTQDTANIMFNYKNSFNPYTQSHYDGGYTRQFLELKGELSIMFKQKSYSIITSLTFPYLYPEIPMIIRIFNPDPIKFMVNPHFQPGASSDGSVVNIHLSELQCWGSHKQIQRVMIQLVQELSQFFPFYEKTSANQQQQANQYNQQGYNQQQPYQQPHQPQQNAYYGGPQQNYGYNQQPQQPQYGQQAPQYGQQQGNYGNQQIEQQLRDKCIKQLESEASELVSEIKKQKKYADQIVKIVMEQESKKQQLEQTIKVLDDLSKCCEVESAQLERSLAQNNTLELNEDTVLNFIKEEDAYSTQVLDLMAELQASKETFHFISEKFRKSELPFEVMVKMTKTMSEQQFNSTLLWKKCLKVQKV